VSNWKTPPDGGVFAYIKFALQKNRNKFIYTDGKQKAVKKPVSLPA
jgi:hypothetical protein